MPPGGVRTELARLADLATLRACLAEGALPLTGRIDLMTKARAVIEDLLQRLPEEDLACLIAPSAELRTLGLLRYAFCLALGERMGSSDPVSLPLRVEGLEAVIRALESLYQDLTVDLSEDANDREDGVARRRLRAYARVCAIGLEAGASVAMRLGYAPGPTPVQLVVSNDEVAEHVASPEAVPLTHWTVRLFDRARPVLRDLVATPEGFEGILRLAVVAGALYREGGQTLPEIDDELETRLARRLRRPLDPEWLAERARTWCDEYWDEIQAPEAAEMVEERLLAVFIAFAAFGYLGRAQLGV